MSDAEPTLDRVGHHIAPREYALAADLLDAMEERFAAVRVHTVQESFPMSLDQRLETVGPNVHAGDVLEINKERPLLLEVDEEIAEKLRQRNFEATFSFDYLDEGEGRVQVLQVPILRPVDEDVRRGAKYWQVCDIHQTATGNWIPAGVRIYKQAAALNHKGPHGFDFAILANTKIRNLQMDFTTYHPAESTR